MINPDEPTTAVVLANEAIAYGIISSTGVIVEPGEVQDFLDEMKEQPEALAKVYFLALEYAGKQQDNWSTSENWLMMQVTIAGVVSYHPAGYKTVAEFCQDALNNTRAGTGAYQRAKAISELVLPYCIQNQIDIPSTVLDKGNQYKFSLLGERAPAVIEAAKVGQITDQEANQRITSMIAGAIDHDKTVAQWKEDHPTGNSPRKLPCRAYEYILPDDQSAIVVVCDTKMQHNRVVRLLDGAVEMHEGTGQETILWQIQGKADGDE